MFSPTHYSIGVKKQLKFDMHDPMDVDQAATVIQTYFRGYQARKEYVKRLLNAYEKVSG